MVSLSIAVAEHTDEIFTHHQPSGSESSEPEAGPSCSPRKSYMLSDEETGHGRLGSIVEVRRLGLCISQPPDEKIQTDMV